MAIDPKLLTTEWTRRRSVEGLWDLMDNYFTKRSMYMMTPDYEAGVNTDSFVREQKRYAYSRGFLKAMLREGALIPMELQERADRYAKLAFPAPKVWRSRSVQARDYRGNLVTWNVSPTTGALENDAWQYYTNVAWAQVAGIPRNTSVHEVATPKFKNWSPSLFRALADLMENPTELVDADD